MLIWANVHPGYYVGHVIFVVCLVAEALAIVMKRDGALGWKKYRILALWSVIGILAAVLNPNAILSITSTRDIFSSPFVNYIAEYLPPWKYAATKGERYFVELLALLITVTAVPLLMSFRRVSFRHAMLYAGFLLMAIKSFRFGLFFAPIAVAITGEYLAMRTSGLRPVFMKAIAAAAVLAVAVTAVLFSPKSVFFSRSDFEGVVPYKAMDFMKKYKPSGPIFNPYIWGGYIGWSLYPQYKAFIDPRCLNYDVLLDQEDILKGDLSKLDRLGINTVIMYPLWFFRTDDYIPELNISILTDSRWQLLYFDGASVIFARKGTAPSGPGFGNDMLWSFYRQTLSAWISQSPQDYRPYALMGKVLLALGNKKNSLEYFRQAKRLLPAGATPGWLYIESSLEQQAPAQ